MSVARVESAAREHASGPEMEMGAYPYLVKGGHQVRCLTRPPSSDKADPIRLGIALLAVRPIQIIRSSETNLSI